MRDGFNRLIDYLRVSVTDRCNFRCVYCMPENGFPFAPKQEILTCEEIYRIVSVAGKLGTRKIRLTGGEPLIRSDLVEIVANIAKVPEIEDISLTTNGLLLRKVAKDLKQVGLNRVNISLDTLQESKFRTIARGGNLKDVMDGIEAAKDAGLTPVKINCVAMRGMNDDEAVDFARWTFKEPIHVRFIEVMPIRWNLDESAPLADSNVFRGVDLLERASQAGDMLSDSDLRKMTIDARELREQIEAELGPLRPHEIPTNGPARTYKLDGGVGTVGFISQISDDLCSKCNRIRLTADGFLRPCLMADGELDVKTPMREGCSDLELQQFIERVILSKPERHFLAEGQKVVGRGMSQIGG